MLSRSKLAVIHVAQARTGLDDDSYRALLKHAAGVGSSKELDDAGFTAVMEVFRQLGFVSTAAKVNLAGRHWSMASDGQVAKLRKLWEAYTDGKGDDARSEEHTSELQSLMRISYAVFCLKKNKRQYNNKR